MLPARIHLVGAGGAGMVGLALYLLDSGHIVSGSDTAPSRAVDDLRRAGGAIAGSHSSANVEGVELIVASDAIPVGNIEIEAGRRLGIPVMRRAECLNALGRDCRTVFVAGSHGKSTTTAMIACVLQTAALRPRFVIGADVPDLGGVRARNGGGEVLVAEACEAFRNLDHFNPGVAVVTNIDDEHVNHYASQAALETSFASFARRAGVAVVAGDDPGVARILPGLQGALTFGLTPQCDVSATGGPGPLAVGLRGRQLGAVRLTIPGDHMRRNALAAIAACLAMDIPFRTIAQALAKFTGVARRWDDHGVAAGVRIIDDYAHHPAEIAATLKTARTVAPKARLVAVFQPLLHSRVERLSDGFADALALADEVILLEVDPGGEGRGSVGSAGIAERLKRMGVAVRLRANVDDLLGTAVGDLRRGDLVIVMGGARMEGAAAALALRLKVPPASAPAKARPALAAAEPRTFIDLFRAAAHVNPEAPALIDSSRVLTYAELDAASGAVAGSLAARGLASQIVGVSLPLSSSLAVALLGVMKAGCVYLPLDPGLPPERARYMAKRAGAAAVIGGDANAFPVGTLSVEDLALQAHPAPPAPAAGDDAYICFTSGSTGFPKGVRIGHAAYAALLADIGPRFALGPGGRSALNTSISFDVSLAEIGGTLASGAALVVGGPGTAVGTRLARLLGSQAVTHLFATPTILASVEAPAFPALRCVIACGEACPPELVGQWAPGRRFFNVYGPTEATIYATAALCRPAEPVSIGTAMPHVAAHVLDSALHPAADGEIGELCLSGLGVTAGYIADPEETARRFVQTTDGWMYRTGDMVVRRADGELLFLGRADTQIKIRGNRIELEEIERTLMSQPAVADAAAGLTEGPPPSLVCFVAPRPGQAFDPAGLKAALTAWLPDSAIPAHIVEVDAIPMTPSGKKDRRRLVSEQRARIVTRASDYQPPRNDVEAQLAKLWREMLKLDFEVGMFDRFAALGGDSFAALNLVMAIEPEFGLQIPPGYFGRIEGIPQMAVQLAELLWQRERPAQTTDHFKSSRIYAQLRELSAQWPGARAHQDSLITTLGDDTAEHDLFLCCQESGEFTAMAARLRPDFRVHGMRSGNLVIDQGPGQVRLLAEHYADEIARLAPRGNLVLAGVCQGLQIARRVAELLSRRGFCVALLAGIEVARPEAYAGKMALFYGSNSFLNPMQMTERGRPAFETLLPGGYSIDLVPSDHTHVANEPGVRFLAHQLTRRVEEAVRGESIPLAPISLEQMRYSCAAPESVWQGWHPAEQGPAGESWRWSGPSRASTILVGQNFAGPVAIRLGGVRPVTPDLLDSLSVRVNGQDTGFVIEACDGDLAIDMEAMAGEQGLQIELSLDRTIRPAEIADSQDQRPLGIRVSWVDVALRETPLPSASS